MTTAAPSFLGFKRPDGAVGVRNHVLVVPTVICAAVVAERIAAAIAPIGSALPHLAGCGQLGPDLTVTHETLAAYARHPNVGAVAFTVPPSP
jgi:altronate dehydratase large subunit